MLYKIQVAGLGLLLTGGVAIAEAIEPFASHRAAYEITLAPEDTGKPGGAQAPIAATGLIAYEFRGSACEGYASTFRQVTQLQRSEGDPIATDIQAVTFEDGDAKSLRFQIDTRSGGTAEPPVSGSAAHGDDGALNVELRKPTKQKVALGKDILFPTQHVEAIIAKAKEGVGTMEARVYDGSDSGHKVFATLTVIGKASIGANADTPTSPNLEKVRRWPISVSYFDDATRDAPPEYVLSFDLYENGVSGSLKLDYGSFALRAKLTRIEWLPTSACAK